MKKRKILKHSILILLAAAAVALGSALPHLTAFYQDRKNQSAVEVAENEMTKLTTSANLTDSIKIMDYGYTLVAVDRQENWTYTDADIREICQNILNDFGEYKLFKSECTMDEGSFEDKVYLAMAGTEEEAREQYRKYVESLQLEDIFYDVDEVCDMLTEANAPDSQTAVVWDCTFSDTENRSYEFWIDDASGKMIAFDIREDNTDRSDAGGDTDSAKEGETVSEPGMADLYSQIDVLEQYCRNYYGLSDLSEFLFTDYSMLSIYWGSEGAMTEDGWYNSGDSDLGFLCILTLEDMNGETFYINLQLEQGRMLLNRMKTEY